MTYSDLLRVTVLLSAAVATALGTVAVILIGRDPEPLAAIVGGAWWLIAALAGFVVGRSSDPSPDLTRVLAGARMATSLPSQGETRIALIRLWPIVAFGFVCAVAAWFWPQVAAIGAGFGIFIALAWRRREAAVQAIEDRDGVRFYVDPTPAHTPLRLTRTPGLYRDRPPHPKPPPPQPSRFSATEQTGPS